MDSNLEKSIEKRILHFRRSLSKKNFDTFLVLTEENRRYLSGFTGEDTDFNESAGTLFITDSKLILATDSRFKLQAEKEAPLYEIFCYKDGLFNKLADILNTLKTERLGFETTRMSYYLYRKLTERIESEKLAVELFPVEDMAENLRIIKEEFEIKQLSKALFIAESAFKNFTATLDPGMTEKEAAWAMEKRMRESGADKLSFPTIAASGPNSALPHAVPGERRFKSGEPILFDWGAKLDGYCSDISRTLVIGRPDETFKKVYATVLDAQQKAIDTIQEGVSSKDVDRAARSHIESKGFKDLFTHSLGHGVGLAVHELPRLSPLNERILRQGMVVTVEPGIYIPGWGGVRLENMVVVQKDGARVLNSLDASDSALWNK
ncbi:MAG TPA: aminopeptidase P family protein [Desulfobacteraceae bacterium]|nr:aminopeptidase P family protein [Desulfobacteraceae bacterium]